jgi:hypothetical protein
VLRKPDVVMAEVFPGSAMGSFAPARLGACGGVVVPGNVVGRRAVLRGLVGRPGFVSDVFWRTAGDIYGCMLGLPVRCNAEVWLFAGPIGVAVDLLRRGS